MEISGCGTGAHDHADHQCQPGDGGECHLPARALAGLQPALPQAGLRLRGFAAGGVEDEGVEGRGRFARAVLTKVLEQRVVWGVSGSVIQVPPRPAGAAILQGVAQAAFTVSAGAGEGGDLRYFEFAVQA